MPRCLGARGGSGGGKLIVTSMISSITTITIITITIATISSIISISMPLSCYCIRLCAPPWRAQQSFQQPTFQKGTPAACMYGCMCVRAYICMYIYIYIYIYIKYVYIYIYITKLQ